LEPPAGVKLVRVESALEMRRAVLGRIKRHRILIMAAAVSDWRPARPAKTKLKKGAILRGAILKRDTLGAWRLKLVANPDILKEAAGAAGPRTVVVGFALETGGLEQNARLKLKAKDMDIIVANRADSGAGKRPFGNAKTDVLIIDRSGRKEAYRGRTKANLAKIILDKALNLTI